ncbi:hypothetical protein CFE70_006696 [Pyrenophora teres f. teres 0-1]|uniref:Uncharacterized protein n=2 Tax=Pyrenophora teres f. teres TaxID=97479 RepID=E3RGH4_PYRTT|nr:hypothetical protein PTT_06907 [Pyrenophora teres f. teres 0-1]KAE8826361.1 hypothetical protein HRS9122_09863 [Pyrenophora teres f. teres]KAE8828315.1 hypothetical protein HRS9139_07534 [Pyrenophora teres f. teres]KAE8830915.1 hypothetical protein PTNB85_07502 [Pyrenophora teres f. teres]KAE8857087.1 hypothetical protein PTNB29_08154 [Pyrenophora teres f. teres]
MLGQITLSFLALQMLAAATPTTQRRDDGVIVTNLGKNVTSTTGTGNVAASGNLASFGKIGVGCGVNWQNDVSYGGGLQAGSSDFGLGGGFTINPNNITIGVGIGLNAANASASVHFTGGKDGSIELIFESSSLIACTPGIRDGKTVVTCKTATPIA